MNAMISIENCWFIITGQSPENEGWYWDYTTTCHIGQDRQYIEEYLQFMNTDVAEISNFEESIVRKVIGHGDIW
jgi:hypothetical protein